VTLLGFWVIYTSRIGVIRVGVEGVCREVPAQLICVTGKVCILVYLLLMFTSVWVLISEVFRRVTHFAGRFFRITKLWQYLCEIVLYDIVNDFAKRIRHLFYVSVENRWICVL
jgi:hypothetical protein